MIFSTAVIVAPTITSANNKTDIEYTVNFQCLVPRAQVVSRELTEVGKQMVKHVNFAKMDIVMRMYSDDTFTTPINNDVRNSLTF